MKIKSVVAALLSVMVVSSGIPTFADTVSQEDFYYYETQSIPHIKWLLPQSTDAARSGLGRVKTNSSPPLSERRTCMLPL